MRPDFYVDEYRRYQTFCRNFSGNELFKIACGPNIDDYNWTESVMRNLNQWTAHGISLHYYTMPTDDWSKKGSAREFSVPEYYKTISKTLFMDELVTRHGEIMNRYDPQHKIGLIVDEWGCWYEVEEGTNPGFLYQQNTMRDAIMAAFSLNIFNAYSKRVKMANLAQAVNVLQALILTEGEKMVLTPTYHVFDLFKGHQGGELVYSSCDDIRTSGEKDLPMISKSASVKDGVLTITLSNCSLDEDAEIACSIAGFDGKNAQAEILTSASVRDFNDFDCPEKVVIKPHEITSENGGFKVLMPACSVVTVTIK